MSESGDKERRRSGRWQGLEVGERTRDQQFLNSAYCSRNSSPHLYHLFCQLLTGGKVTGMIVRLSVSIKFINIFIKEFLIFYFDLMRS